VSIYKPLFITMPHSGSKMMMLMMSAQGRQCDENAKDNVINTQPTCSTYNLADLVGGSCSDVLVNPGVIDSRTVAVAKRSRTGRKEKRREVWRERRYTARGGAFVAHRRSAR
jgi:hypothetical protein